LPLLPGLCLAACLTPAREPGSAADRPLEIARDGYVTSSTCRACHPGQYASWYGSFHRRMTQVAGPDAIAAAFDGERLELQGATYALERRGDEFWIEIREPSGGAVDRRPVVLTTGSHHRQWVWMPSGDRRRLGALPFIYLIEERQWVPRIAAFMQPPDPGWEATFHDGLWGVGCIQCHTTHGQVASESNPEAQVVEFGIACEACHGPGAEHVAANHDPRRRYEMYLAAGTPDPTITNPRKLPHARAAEVCGQCHSVIAAPGTFRAGDDLRHDSSGRRENPNPEASLWSDGMVRAGGREYDALIATPCYQRGEMTCHSCHAMHRKEDDPRPIAEWAADQLLPGMDADAGCVQCHAASEPHSHHEPGSSGSRCYNCHTPYTSYALLKAIRNHQVVAPDVSADLATGRPNACNLCHLDRSLGWTADHLERWYETPRPDLSEDEEAVAAAVLWATAGHAGQRALAAWHMGWKPAQEASGTTWLTPYLTLMLNDPYPAVRIIAYRSLRTLAPFADFDYDYVGPEEQRQAAVRRLVALWRSDLARASETGDRMLIGPDGSLRQHDFVRLVGVRDDRPINWVE
jgi:hypothetical protein